MNTEDFKFLCELMKKRSGIVLGEDKAYLLESRLSTILRKRKIDSLAILVSTIQMKWDETLINEIIDAMTTNESLFFRDMKPFQTLKRVCLPQLLQARAATKKIRIWSAACSSGQEAFSIAMTIAEDMPKFNGWTIEILGTDISDKILEKGKEGIYSQFEIQRGLPVTMLVKYFTHEDTNWRIKPELKKMVQLKHSNLIEPPNLGTFDIIMCRNVLIYFDRPTKAAVFDHLANSIAKDGYLFLGGAETTIGVTEKFSLVPGERAVYQCVGNAGAAHAAM